VTSSESAAVPAAASATISSVLSSSSNGRPLAVGFGGSRGARRV